MSKSNKLASILGDGTGVFVDSDHIPSNIVYKNNGSIDSSSLPSNIVYGSGGLEAGTVAFFGQTAAPTGWTKDTSIDNTALRVVSGTVGSGGNDSFTTTFGTGKTTAGHTLTTGQMPSHSHGILPRFSTDGDGFSHPSNSGTFTLFRSYNNLSSFVATENTGGNQAHSHNLANFNLKYVDVIRATKG